jgi:SAM-dependent methyltransferase
MHPVSGTYSDVDGSADPAEAVAWMDVMASWPSVREYKQRTLELIADWDGLVLDVGCGVGDDVRALGEGAVGLDTSDAMLAEANERGNALFVKGDVHALPFDYESLGGVRTDRVLQHVADPGLALDEIVRVLKRNGVVVLAEPDQATLRIIGTDPDLTQPIIRYRTDVGVRNGRFASRLAPLLRSLGMRSVNSESFPISISDPADAFGLPTWPQLLVERGWFTEGQADRFLASLDHAVELGTFRYAFDVVVTWGHRG